ncbi:MAG: hypothetical protein ABIT07_02130 [Ferruginibacter sp.]
MNKKRKIEMVLNLVSYKDAEKNDDSYFAKLSPAELLKECFDLRKLNYFNGKENNLPRIEKVGVILKRNSNEKQNA